MREPNRLRMWTLAAGELSGSLGLQIALFAIPLLAVEQLHASPIQMGVLNLLDSAAALSFGIAIGAAVDRLGGIVAVGISEAIRFLAIAILGTTLMAGPTLWALYVGMFIVGAASLMHEAGVSAAVVEFGDRSPAFLNRANALLRGSSVVSELAGPGAAGFLVVALGFGVSLFGGALGFAIAALCAVAVLKLRSARPRGSSSRLLAEVGSRSGTAHLPASGTSEVPMHDVEGSRGISQGVRYIWSHRVLRPLVLSTVQFNFFTAAFQAVFLYYCVHQLRFSTLDLAITGVAAGIGGIAGSFLVATRGANGNQKAWYLSSLAAPALAVIAILLADGHSRFVSLALVSAAECVWASAMVICVVLFNTLRQVSSPAPLVGQVAASERVLAVAGEVPGALLGGFVGAAYSVQAPMLAAMLGIALSILWAIRAPDWSPAAAA